MVLPATMPRKKQWKKRKKKKRQKGLDDISAVESVHRGYLAALVSEGSSHDILGSCIVGSWCVPRLGEVLCALQETLIILRRLANDTIYCSGTGTRGTVDCTEISCSNGVVYQCFPCHVGTQFS